MEYYLTTHKLPAFTVGKKVLINYDMLLEQLNNLGGIKTDYASDYSVDFSGDQSDV